MLRSILLPLAFALAGSAQAAAHPHLFIESSVHFVFTGQALTGLKVEWVFDEFFTQSILLDYDRNKNGAFEEAEIRSVEKNAFANLVNFGFFIHLSVDGKELPVKQVRDFTCFIRESLVYSFTVPLNVPALAADRTVRLAIFDPTYFTDIVFAKTDFARVDAGPSIIRTTSRRIDRSRSYFGGMVSPEEISLVFRRTR